MLTAPTPLLAARLARVRRDLAGSGLDALVVTSLPNLAYLSNFDGSAGIGLVDARRLYLLSDFRYSAAVLELLASPAAPPDVEFVLVDGTYEETLARVAEGTGARVIGLEASSLPLKRAEWWRHRLRASLVHEAAQVPALGRTLLATDGMVEAARMVKDPHEVALLREGARRLSAVAAAVVDDAVRPGLTEAGIAADIDARMKRAGFSRPAFETIVASGPTNSAQPHARPTGRVVGDGELVVLDFGGVYEGYCVDLTRTVATGTPSADARRLYRSVREAHERAVRAVRPGVTADVVDAAARDHLTAVGLGEAFGHGTGHGLGLEVHEEPRVGKRRADGPPPATLVAGVVCTIEPGVYVPGTGGVRLEDDVLVTDEGCEVLTEVPLDGRLGG